MIYMRQEIWIWIGFATNWVKRYVKCMYKISSRHKRFRKFDIKMFKKIVIKKLVMYRLWHN